MDSFKQVGKSLGKDRSETALNTRRIQANLPLVERKLDDIAGDRSYYMEFPVTAHDHTISLNLKIKPDNCCDCEPGAQTVGRDAFAYFYDFSPPADGTAYPIIYAEPLQQTGTIFNYGYNSPFFYPSYIQFPVFGGYTIDPAGGVVVPVDGMYSILFKNIIETVATSSDAYMTLSIRQNGESISQKTYSVSKGNLPLTEIGSFTKQYYQYALCVPLHEGDIVGAWVEGNMTSWNFEPGYWGGGPRTDRDTTRFSLLGLGFGTLIGRVFDNVTNLGISGATVSYTMGFGGSTTTNSDGTYEFIELTPGFYSLTASKSGYTSMTRDVEVLFDEIAILDFNLVV